MIRARNKRKRLPPNHPHPVAGRYGTRRLEAPCLHGYAVTAIDVEGDTSELLIETEALSGEEGELIYQRRVTGYMGSVDSFGLSVSGSSPLPISESDPSKNPQPKKRLPAGFKAEWKYGMLTHPQAARPARSGKRSPHFA